MEVTMTPVIMRSNKGESPEHGKCSNEGGYEKYKATILIGSSMMELLVSTPILKT